MNTWPMANKSAASGQVDPRPQQSEGRIQRRWWRNEEPCTMSARSQKRAGIFASL
ncbi:MAG: hypothetical protein AB9917_00225 [Negativicutes bacterium]